MDSSPLLRAHEHARAASVATRQHASDSTVAINEHTQAAGEFATAAAATSSVEALRMLRLLEDHHRRLAELLNLPAPEAAKQQQHASSDDASTTDEKVPVQREVVITQAGTKDEAKDRKASDSQAAKSSQKPGPPQQRRIASREMSSSIASNLASARGIRSKYHGQPLTPSVSNDQAPGNLDTHPRRTGSKAKMQTIIDHQTGKPTWVPPMPASSSSGKEESRGGRTAAASSTPTDPHANPVDDGGYTKFYNTFGNLMNRLSAPLAFAGLPLIQEESTTSEEPAVPAEPSSKRKQTPQSPGPVDADLSKIYSKSTMRAMANEGYAPNESFYVVPTSGHTISYANILSYAEKERRRLGASTSSHGTIKEEQEDEDDDFVDAREGPVSFSPGAQRRIGRARTEKELGNTIEELYTENKSLKDMLDKLTKRLHTFEASAQKMSESYRFMRPGSPPPVTKSGDRQSVMEEEFSIMKQHVEKLEKDNKKMQKTLEKYREKWETLKAGAKARREAQGSAAESVEDARMS